MSETITTLHPAGKQGVNIALEKYTLIRHAILKVVAHQGEIAFKKLAEEVTRELPAFDGAIGWYTTTIKLDLEARGIIRCFSKNGLQFIRFNN